MRVYLFIFVFVFVSSSSAQTRQVWRDSLETLSANLKQNPTNIDLRLRKAEADIQLEQWDYALAEYGRILRADERNLAALFFRAYVHEKQKHYDLAKVDYDAFLAIEPVHLEARLGLAHVLQKMGRKQDTIDELNRIVQMFPDSADAYAARAAYETELQQYEVAVYDWGEAARLNPDNVDYTISKVDVLLRLGRQKEAREALDSLVARGTPRGLLKEWYDRTR
jgi:tetratricopeptide (TPR) repeat protein